MAFRGSRKYLEKDEERWQQYEMDNRGRLACAPINGPHGLETMVLPSDKEFLEDAGLQLAYANLDSMRKFLENKYPHITHIAGWQVPKK